MRIPIVGDLQPHPKVPEWLVSQPIAVPYFDDKKLTFTFDALDATDENEAQNAVSAFLALGPQDRSAASQYVFANYCYVAELVGADQVECRIHSPNDVWHVQPSEIYVSRRARRERLIYVQVAAECDWEPEHGLQIVYRRGNELSRVSDQDGHLTHADAYDLAESEDRIVEQPKGEMPPDKPWWKL
jgi:hypothetical protein